MKSSCAYSIVLAVLIAIGSAPSLLHAQGSPPPPPPPTPEELATSIDVVGYAVDNIVMMICAVLVLFMQAGFAMLTAGFVSQKNVVNILFKNVMDMCIGVTLYYVIGFGLMYPTSTTASFPKPAEAANKYVDFGGFGIQTIDPAATTGTLHPQVDWLFQAAFAAAAATIVAGAVAGRMQFKAYLIYSAILTGVVYPISGYWKWGGGWLDQIGFYDFAGSGVVHMVGGFAGLAGALVLGPRMGRYTADGKPVPMPGHSITIATLGVFILWIGWYGFNPGSQLATVGAANTNAIMKVAVNTTLSGAIGGIVAMACSWSLFGKADFSMALNGALGGLVGITANCDGVTNWQAMEIGAVAGVLIVLGVMFLDKLKIDDPVGAWPVHGLCGMWGVLATGIFGDYSGNDPAANGSVYGNMTAQITGIFALACWAFVTMFAVFLALRIAKILRVSPEEEAKGLDISEHGMSAYTSA